MKKLLVFCLGLVLILSFFAGCKNDADVVTEETEEATTKEAAVPAEETTAAEEKRTMTKIGRNDEFIIATMHIPPYHYANDEGEIDLEKGFLMEIAIATLKEMGQKFRFINTTGIDWDKQMQDLKAGEFHMWYSLFDTADQKVMFNFAVPSGGSGFRFFEHKERPSGVVGNTDEKLYKSISGKKVATIKTLKAALTDKNRDFEALIGKDQFAIFDMVMDGKADVAYSPDGAGWGYIIENKLPLQAAGNILEYQSFAPAFSKTVDAEIIERWNKAYKTVRDKGIIKQILAKYGMKS